MSATAGQTAVQAGPAARSPEAERRQLTVLACELVPQNELAARLDPKELREAQREYQDAFCQAARRANGYLAELRNDGLSVYFGYPAAREDDARQAVATAMDLVEIATKLSGQRERLQLDVRIGVHTGLVLAWDVRQAEGRPMAIAGVTPTTAARLKELAQRNTVLISGSTHRLVRGYFACLNLGMRTVRGATQPIETYQVSYESGARSRLEGITSRGLTPLIGRDLEIGLLMDRWQRVEDGAGQVVFVSGEAGIGKSRLARVFRERLEASAHMWVESRCLPHQRDRMLLPVAALFQSMFRLDGETPAQNLDKLERALKHFSFSPLETVPALASLLSLPLDSPYPKALPEPEEEQQKVQEVLLGVLSRMARRQPVVLMMADLHWADAATVSLVGRIIQEAPTSAIFILLTARPVFIPPWPARSHVTSLPLSRLTPKRIKTMAEEVAHGKSLPVEVIDQLIAKTDGIPLFIEELTKTILESGLLVEKGYEYELVAPLPQLVIPSTLRDALMARLDMLGAAKRVAQLAAILGKEFPYEVLEAVSALDPLILQGALDRLVDADLLYVRGRPPRARYTFKHVLMQDTAYESMLHSKRQGYHRNVAQILMDRFPDLVESQPEIVARHYTLGGMNDQAVPHWQRAAQGRLDIAVCEEATGYLTREILQLDSAPRGADRDRQEMALLASLCPLLRSAKGVAAPEVERAYARAKDAAERLKTSPDIFPMLMDVWQFYHAREDLDTALTLGKQALELAKGTSNRLLLMQAQGAIGATFLHMGKLALARLHLEQATTTDERDRRRPLLSTTGHDAGVTCLVNAAWTLWLTGYPEQSAQHAERALSLAKAISHPQSLYFASISNGLLHGCLGRGAIGPHAEPMSGLSVEQPAPFWAAAATLLEGAALVEQGKVDDGISTMTRALHTERSTSMRLWLGAFAAIVANACQRNNQAERGMSLLAEPVERLSRPGGDRLCEPEIYRLQGELTLMRVVGTGGAKIDRAEVERTFRHAIEVARTQEARMLALRAAVSLGRLLRDQDRRAEAADIIRSIFQSFTEGLDMPDMRDATLLLNSLHLK
jgi:predicted ATPase/class 3 adenylate cyclase